MGHGLMGGSSCAAGGINVRGRFIGFAFALLLCYPIVFSVVSLAEEEYIGFAQVQKGETNLRESPGGNLLCKLEKEDMVYVLDREESASGVVWYKATINHNKANSCETMTGYVRGDLLTLPPFLFTDVEKISASKYHMLCILRDGRVLAVGSDHNDVLEVRDWMGMVDVVAGNLASVGLRPDGTVAVLTDTRAWVDPKWAGVQRLVKGRTAYGGIKADGTVLIHYEVNNTSEEIGRANRMAESIGQVADLAILPEFVAGLKPDGTVQLVWDGEIDERLLETVSGWRDVVDIAGAGFQVVALRKDGSVVAAMKSGRNDHGQCEVDSWTDIIAIDTADTYTLGLKKDGTLMITRNTIDVSGLTDITSIQAAESFVAALTKDGRVVFRGDYHFWAIFGVGGHMVVSD